MTKTMEKSIYALQDVPGKGKGLVATEKIPRGTRILSEEPIIVVPSDQPDSAQLRALISKQVEALSESDRQTFLSMHNIHPYKSLAEQYLGIFRTNALPTEINGGSGAIFFEACRVNHACDNNAQKNWNENIKRHTVHAKRDIEKGEEITIFYLGTVSNRKTRQAKLKEGFKFDCRCHLCSLPIEESEESDRRLEEALELDRLIGQGGLGEILKNPLRILRYVDRLVRVYNEQGPGDAGLPRAFFDAAQIAIANGDLARGRIFAERATDGWKLSSGEDSVEVIAHGEFARDPANPKHGLYGLSKKWDTPQDAVPIGLQPSEFEDWLWRREKPRVPGQLTDLRCGATFPGFMNLPDENDIDDDFYTQDSRGVYRPRRHWCYLGEIVEFFTITRLQMELMGVDGNNIPLFFYTHGRGREIPATLIQKGYTVAILYAEQHAFMFSEPGIRLENPRAMKIFPVSLDSLLELSDQVQKFSPQQNGLRTCHGCGEKGASLKKCAKCSSFWYCNKECQIAAWNEKGHKAQCKLLKDPDVRGLFLLDWDKFENHVSFPLPGTRGF